MARTRRKARALALQALYEIDSVGHEVEEVLTRLFTGEAVSEENATFIREMVEGVIRNRDKIDSYIRKFAPAWPIKQIAIIDRNILRLAIFEILIDNKVPVKVAINEAVELAKAFGSDNSFKFVNGVLGSVSTLVSNKLLEKGGK